MFENITERQAREQILSIVAEYTDKFHKQKPYSPEQRIPYASRVFDRSELTNLVDSALDFWLTAGKYTEQFEERFPKIINSKFCSLVNSGSSANLLAFMSLSSPLLEDRAIRPGDEVITVAAAFPTTVSPIIQYGAIPVFVDITIPQYNIDVSRLESAYSPKTRAVILAHSLGNPFDLKMVKQFCDDRKLWLIEDNCDSLGASYTMGGNEQFTGTIGDMGTSSFYPAHHITMGEGGAVYTDNPLLHKILRSMRDWGRDCVCPGGRDNMCGHRFEKQYGELPIGYDHKYVYSHFGYNLKVTDMQAAIGCAQLEKLPSFVERRRHNWQRLRDGLEGLEEKLILPEPAPNSKPSWFGFMVTCNTREHTPEKRNKLTRFIEEKKVQTRTLFAGNIVKHPCFDQMRKNGTGYRIAGSLENTDRVLNNSFWVGVYPGMTDKMIDRMIEVIREGVKKF
ncbi:MAG: lipopolysaccharide biosynthesis protein RfbH [Treponema sp.]|jgi:CDP-6-deoxy-D-xylo-4-hexulose-3-dehydrase|nr:lipopolysaccharide biosynthesis protein RfbH [Treponema sp.]